MKLHRHYHIFSPVCSTHIDGTPLTTLWRGSRQQGWR